MNLGNVKLWIHPSLMIGCQLHQNPVTFYFKVLVRSEILHRDFLQTLRNYYLSRTIAKIHAEILPRDFLQSLGNYYLSLTIAKIRAEILPRDFLQTVGNYYLSLAVAKVQRLKKIRQFLKALTLNYQFPRIKVHPTQRF